MSESKISENDKAIIDQMNKEKTDNGFKPSFPDDDSADKTQKAKDETKADESKVDASKADTSKKADDDKTQSRKSRAPLSDYRENIKKSFEEKYNAKINELETELKTYKGKKDTTPADDAEFKKELEAKATELNVKPEHLQAILELSDKRFQNKIKPLQEKVDKYEKTTTEKTQEQMIAEQVDIFEDQWSEIEPSIKEKYPNATKEQIEAAKTKMDDLAYDDRYADKDMDYIIFKESQEFEKILFSPKKKTFETDSSHEGDLNNQDDEDLFTSTKKPQTYADVEKQGKKFQKFEEGIHDSRFKLQ